MSDLTNFGEAFDLRNGIAQVMLEFESEYSPESQFIVSNSIGQAIEQSRLKFALKLYNGPYIDNWIILNFTLKGSAIGEALRLE